MPAPDDLLATKSLALEFDEAEHRYTLDGRVVPSVTQVLHLAGLVDDRWYTDFGRQRGTLVHTLLEYEDLGDLEESTVDDRLRPYLDAYRQFKSDTGIDRWDCVERRLGDPVRQLAGTLDRFGAFGLLDVKSGTEQPWIALQTALYALLAEVNGLALSARRMKRWGLFLRSTGDYRLVPYADPSDFAIADAARLVAQWRLAHDAAA